MISGDFRIFWVISGDLGSVQAISGYLGSAHLDPRIWGAIDAQIPKQNQQGTGPEWVPMLQPEGHKLMQNSRKCRKTLGGAGGTGKRMPQMRGLVRAWVRRPFCAPGQLRAAPSAHLASARTGARAIRGTLRGWCADTPRTLPRIAARANPRTLPRSACALVRASLRGWCADIPRTGQVRRRSCAPMRGLE